MEDADGRGLAMISGVDMCNEACRVCRVCHGLLPIMQCSAMPARHGISDNRRRGE